MSKFDKEREYYIFGEPIETDLGTIKFITYKDYLRVIGDLSVISMNSLHIYYHYSSNVKPDEVEILEQLELLKEEPLYNIVLSTESILESYVTVFSMVMEDVEKVTEIFKEQEKFDYYRELIMDMNMLSEVEVSKNPEIQKFIESSRKLKSEGAESPTPTDIVTSIVAGTSNSFDDVCNMTVIQAHSIFYRIGAFKNFDTTVLFATVSSDVKIEPWSKSIDLYGRETSTIKKKEFTKKYGDLIS